MTQHTPRIGDPITYEGNVVGTVTKVEGNLCWRTYPDGERLPFIWRFHDGLNALHSWPGKEGKLAPLPAARGEVQS